MSQDDGNSYDGRIWCRDEDRDRVNDMKSGGETQADVLERVLDFYEDHDPDAAPATQQPDTDALADAVAERVSVTAEVDPDAVAAALAERVDVQGANPDDVRAAAERGVEQALEGR